MPIICNSSGKEIYSLQEYTNESDLEKTIQVVKDELFGRNRIYLDVKKKIGSKGSLQNIPDGYLIDLSGKTPRLFVVENELSSHDPLRHIATQLLQFSLSFEDEPRRVKEILYNALKDAGYQSECETYAQVHGYRNLDNLLDWLVHETPFAALVIIDEIPPRLLKVVSERFKFGVEVIELKRYFDGHKYLYTFEPFLADVNQDILKPTNTDEPISGDIDELDTVVIPARPEGFLSTFIGENCWHAIRLHGTMRPQIKYIAAYQVAPISAITHIAPVKSIEPWGDSGKYVVYFSEPAKEINPPIKLVPKGRVKALQNLRYATLNRLEQAKTLDDIW